MAIFFDFMADLESRDVDLANVSWIFFSFRKTHDGLTGSTKSGFGSFLEDETDCYQRVEGRQPCASGCVLEHPVCGRQSRGFVGGAGIGRRGWGDLVESHSIFDPFQGRCIGGGRL